MAKIRRCFTAELRKYYLEAKCYYPDHIVNLFVLFIMFLGFFKLFSNSTERPNSAYYIGFVYWFYANGIIGPSLLDKTDAQIVDMIKKYKFKEKPNPLMVQLVNGMSEQQIETMAKEIYEFNRQFKEQK